MKENAKQGFWNGASPPLGYNLVEAERRGQKIKKHLAIDPVEAETVRLIFHLYAEGEMSSGTPPLGIKQLVKWLNSHGYRTKAGGTFGVGPLHHILTNTVYIGRWRYNVRSARTGELKPVSEIVEITTPVIVEQDLFDRVQVRLVANNPKVTAPRVVTGPILLTGLARCAHCGGGMTQRTGTSSTGRVYAYYACASRAQKGPTACRGNTIRMAFLDDLVLTALRENMFTPERLTELLSVIAAKRQERTVAVDRRLASLKSQVVDAEGRLKRLYRGIEEGIVELDDLLRERIAELKADRQKAQAAYDHAAAQASPSAAIDPDKIAAFSRLMTDLLANGETPARKAYLRTLIGAIIVGDKSVKIVGSREAVRAAVLGKPSPLQNVRGLGPEWRAARDSNFYAERIMPLLGPTGRTTLTNDPAQPLLAHEETGIE
ncbi:MULTISPECIES: recombinase family protein [unclassified Nitrobacter]|uniref:recombinase family protein n=1 Tax=unclassified Nitrobacter TaxID=2620411 RepID=UPI0025D49426|nr:MULTISPECIES: recombinase family protein [unclassified Nitrobacter]